jgi:peptide/nickel transport system permease protein
VNRPPLVARLVTSIVVMALVALITFLLLDIAPGTYLDELATNPQISAATLQQMREQYGLDQPFYRRFWRWARGTAAGDFGYSFVYQRPIRQLVAERIGNTILLNLVALAAAWTLGIALGLAAAASRGSPVDWAVGGATTVLLATPSVLLAVMALAFAARFQLPIGGMTLSSAAGASPTFGARMLDLARHLALPAATIALVWLPVIARHTRTAVLSALAAPYALAARAKGVGRWHLLMVHAFREALGPLSSLFGLTLSGLLSASRVVEVVMAWPGLGQLTYDALFKRDIFLVVDLVQVSALLLIVGNMAGEILLRRLDPRAADA